MDKLQELINTFSKEDNREFKIFINRQKSKKDRKDLQLFDLINQEFSPKEIQNQLYDTPNKVAYHTLRKRLLKHLTDFIVLKQIDTDITSSSSISGLISLSGYLINNQSHKLAWRFLVKAERMASENENYELLNDIYQLQIKDSDNEYAVALDETFAKWKANKQMVDENERVNIAYSYIKKEINNIKLSGEYRDINNIINNMLKQHEVKDVALHRPEIIYKIMDITRKVMFSKKDFFSFEPYVIMQYKELIKKNVFTKRNHGYKINILYMIAHALYRNRKFNESNTYLKLMAESMNEQNQIFRQQFLANYILLKAANHTYLYENQKSIDLLSMLDGQALSKMNTKDQLNIQLNLAVYHFNQNEFKEANKFFLHIGHSDNWLEKKMGKEWVLKKNLIEIIVQFELDNTDIVLNRIRSFERSFNHLFEHPIYQRVKFFTTFIKTLTESSQESINEHFIEKTENTLINIPKEQEDLQAMAFYAWLKSKLIQQNYYDVLMEIVHSKDD